jgi:hypothetical protein
VLLTLALVASGAGVAHADAPSPRAPRDSFSTSPPVIELWTMGQGEDVFERFGHAALCVYEAAGEESRCYNYGATTLFDDPLDLVVKFVRHQAPFTVSITSAERMYASYARADRTIYRQVLPLTPAQAEALVERLRVDEGPPRLSYMYDHFADNCTTRVRDHIDAVTGGALRRGNDVPLGPPLRALVRAGFSADWYYLTFTEVMLGRHMDTYPTRWEAMFHPDHLRLAVWERFGAEPRIVLERTGRPLTVTATGGQRLLALVGFVLAAVAGLGVASGLRVTRRLVLILTGLVLGSLAVVVHAVAIYCLLPDLRWNENLLVFLPTDLALVFLGGRALRWYLNARLALLALVALAALVGVLVQPLVPTLFLVGFPLLCVRAGLGRGWALGRLTAPAPPAPLVRAE